MEIASEIFPPEWYIFGDRGFADLELFYKHITKTFTPKFLSGRKQFTPDEIQSDLILCKLRYTAEVAFSRMTQGMKVLSGIIPRENFSIAAAANSFGHGICMNFGRPLKQPYRFPQAYYEADPARYHHDGAPLKLEHLKNLDYKTAVMEDIIGELRTPLQPLPYDQNNV